MITIQTLGKEILSNNFRKFYVFCGQEYGIKKKYLDIIKSAYKGNIKEISSMKDFIQMMKVKHLIPLPPSLYVVRYDQEFIKAVNAMTYQQIQSLNYAGTCVCIYEDTSIAEKLDKHLPEAVALIDAVNPMFIKKYLMKDYESLDEGLAGIASNIAVNYGHARNIAVAMTLADTNKLKNMDEKDISKLFGISSTSTEKYLQQCIASRNFNSIIDALDRYPEVDDTIFYVFAQTMNELEKIKTYPRTDSILKKYEKGWTCEDIYNFFNHSYNCLLSVRSGSSSDIETFCIYLAGLLQFRTIPSVEDMKCYL